jgi:hypothetical protein
MKQPLLLLALATLLMTSSACNKAMIQIATIKPNGKNIKETSDYYVFENDTVKIVYAFWVVSGKFEFTIENKLTTPIYIDWKKSNLVYNDAPNVYWTEETTVNSKSVSTGIGIRGSYGIAVGTAVTSEESVIRPKERITFLPPASRITRNEYAIEKAKYYVMDLNNAGESVKHAADEKKMTTIYEQVFSKENTPIRMRNFLTLSSKENFESEWFIENSFYLHQVQEMELTHFRGKCTGVDANDQPICPKVLKSNKRYYLMVPKGWDFLKRKKMKLTQYVDPL